MANNYVQFSTAIEELTEEESAWLADLLITLRCAEDFDLLSDEGTADYEDRYHYVVTAFRILAYEDLFSVDTELKKEKGYLWIYSEESGNVDQAVLLIQEFLKEFRPADVHFLSWSETCSKMRINEFGGGTVLITADFQYRQPDRMVMDKMADAYTKYKKSDLNKKVEVHEC